MQIGARLGICLTRKENPEMTLQEIGNKFDLSRERVRQILKQMDLPTKHKSFGSIITQTICPKCGRQKLYRAKYCRKCRKELLYEFVQCETCRIPIKRRISYTSYMKERRGYKHIWCSKKCQGKWLANNYGFIVHPENAGKK